MRIISLNFMKSVNQISNVFEKITELYIYRE